MSLQHLRTLIPAIVMFISLEASAQVNIRTSPLHLLAGVGLLEADFKLSGNWSLGPTFAYSNSKREGFDTTYYALGARGNYYFAGTFSQGWYLSPGLQYISATVKDDSLSSGEIEGKASGVAVNFYGGYFWIWENFNIQLGAGPIYYSVGKITVENKSQNYKEDFDGFNGGTLGVEFSMGWKF